jgi:lipopolysaccharide cholinephosphotransferase
MCVLKRTTHDLLNLRKAPEVKIYERYIKTIGKSCGDYITSFDVERMEQMIACCSKYDDVFPTVRIPFADMEVSIQKNYHEALKKQYGNYMEMPPLTKRYNHPPEILDFGDGKGNVIN